jgi:hypothetical protein
MNSQIISFEEQEPRHPYSGAVDLGQEWVANNIECGRARIDICGDRTPFVFFAKLPDFQLPYDIDKEMWRIVVRGNTDAGTKRKNFLKRKSDGELYVKSRGTPWTTDKQWTNLNCSVE